MNADLTKALIDSTRHVFKTLFVMDVEAGRGAWDATMEQSAEVSAHVALWGDLHGSVTIRMSSAMARRISAMLTGEQAPEVNDWVIDAVGELASMIVEGALGRLSVVSVAASCPIARLAGQSDFGEPTPAQFTTKLVCSSGDFVIETRTDSVSKVQICRTNQRAMVHPSAASGGC